jgi:hypothetical protein
MAQLGPNADGMHQSLAEVDAASHTFRLAQVENDHKRKGTGTTYDQHVRRYVQFWSQYQAELNLGNPLRVSVPSFPKPFLTRENMLGGNGLWRLTV